MGNFEIDNGIVIRVLTDEIRRLEWSVEAERNRAEKLEEQLKFANDQVAALVKKIDEIDNF